jgi:hypothetical protein
MIVGYASICCDVPCEIPRILLLPGLCTNYVLIYRDGNSVRVPDTCRVPDGYGYGDDFLSVGVTRTRPEPRRVRDVYFFLLAGNPTSTRYYTIAIILGCEQVKMYSFCYINYDLF